jgi:hypothetical protein
LRIVKGETKRDVILGVLTGTTGYLAFLKKKSGVVVTRLDEAEWRKEGNTSALPAGTI